MIDYSRYYRAYAEMKDTLDGDYAHEYFVSAMADADKGEDDLSGNAYNRVIDMEWVEKIEYCLPYIEKAIDEQRKFIEEYKEVDRIDKVKQVGKDAVQHLTQHANLIMALEPDGSVIPEKLLNTHREDSFATYENRFLHTLIFKTIAFVEARFRALQDAPNDSSNSLSISREVTLNDAKFGFDLHYSSESHERDKIGREEEITSLTDYERIERIRMKLDDFVGTDLIKSLKNCIAVKSPINRTNCIKQDPAFKICYDLWVFIESYRKTGYVLEKNEFEGKMPEEVQKEMYDVMAFQHFVSVINTNKALKEKLHAAYVEENERRAREANKPEDEMARYLEEKIYEARREEMAIRLREVREREVKIAALTAELEEAKEQIRLRDIKINELQSLIKLREKELEETRNELRIAQQRIAELEAELEKAKARIAELEQRVAELEAQVAAQLAAIAALEAQVAKLQQQIAELTAIIEPLKAKIAEQEEIIAKQASAISSMNDQISSLNENVYNLTNENTAMKETIARNDQVISQQAAKIVETSTALNASLANAEDLSTRLNDLTVAHNELTEKYSVHGEEITKLNGIIDDNNAQIAELEHVIRVKENMLSAKAAIIDTLNNEKAVLGRKAQEIDAENAKKNAERDALMDKYKNYESDVVALNTTIKSQSATIGKRNDTIKSLQSQISRYDESKNAEIAGVKADYESKLSAMQADYEARIRRLEQEKIDVITFSDDGKYEAKLQMEKKKMQREYDAKLKEATKKARKFARRARILLDDYPRAVLDIEDAKDYL